MNAVAADLIEEVSCLLCADDRKRVRVNRPPFRIVQCLGCGLVYTDRRFTSSGMEAYYAKPYFTGGVTGSYPDYAGEEREKQHDFDLKYQVLRRFIGGGTALDVGCALGFSLDAAARAGFSPTGVERSRWAVDNKRTREAMLLGSLDDVDAGAGFDLVTMWDVLEHLPNPEAAFEQLRRVTKVGGLFAVTFPDPNTLMARVLGRHWMPFTPEEHVFFPTTALLTRWLSRYGFTIRHAEMERRAVSIGKLVQKLSIQGRGQVGRAPGGRIIHIAIPYKRLAVFERDR